MTRENVNINIETKVEEGFIDFNNHEYIDLLLRNVISFCKCLRMNIGKVFLVWLLIILYITL